MSLHHHCKQHWTWSAVEGVATELELPEQPEATIRLHKARIKALSGDLTASQAALKDK